MQLFDVAVLFLAVLGLAISLRAVWNIRSLRSRLISERRQHVRQVLAAVGDIESLAEAETRATAIGEIMKSHGVAGLILPLKSGGRVNLQLETSGLRIGGA